MNNSEKVDLLLIFGECQRNVRQAARLYAERYPDRYHPHHNYMGRLIRGLTQHGHFPGHEQRQRRPNNFAEETELQVLAYMRAYPRSSIRHVSREVGRPISTVHKILKKHKMHPYKADFVQHLRIGDAERRLNFVAWLVVQLEMDNLFFNNIFWTDESKFTNNGVMNKQNSRYWEDTNPHWTRERNNQTVWGVNVWCGIIGGKLIGPYFFDETLTGRRYLNFLNNELPLLLEDVPLATRERMYFQQDGAPAHNAIIVRQRLGVMFRDRLIGTYGDILWPPRSPDLTPLDFFLWGYLKTEVYKDPPTDIEDLKNKIQLACNNLSEDQIRAATSRELLKRLELCLEHQGGNFEHFIR